MHSTPIRLCATCYHKEHVCVHRENCPVNWNFSITDFSEKNLSTQDFIGQVTRRRKELQEYYELKFSVYQVCFWRPVVSHDTCCYIMKETSFCFSSAGCISLPLHNSTTMALLLQDLPVSLSTLSPCALLDCKIIRTGGSTLAISLF